MFTAVMLVSICSQPLTFPKTIEDTMGTYYDLDPPADPPVVLRLLTGADGKTLVILTKNALGVWEGSHAGTTYRMRKEMLPYTWKDRTTRAWWYTASALPSAAPIPESAWCGPDKGFRFQPFFYGRAHIGTISP